MFKYNKKLQLLTKMHRLSGMPLALFFTLIFVTACNDKNDQPDSASHSAYAQTLLSSPTSINTEDTTSGDEVKTWYGQDIGFVSADNPLFNKIEALIALGKINAATLSYRNTSTLLSNQANEIDVKLWRAHATASINHEILEIYDSLDLVFQKNNIKPFRATLKQLATPETIEIYTSTGNNKELRQQKNEITQATRIITASVLNAISVLAPSRKEYMLAGSAMLQQSGENLQHALSADGKITDLSKHQLGISQIDSVLSLIPKFVVNVCEEQRKVSQTYRDNTNKIVEQFMSFGNKPVQARVSDIYALAKQTEIIAKNLPEKDQDICNGS